MIVMIVQRAGVEPANAEALQYPVPIRLARYPQRVPFMSRSLLPTGILKRIDQVAAIQRRCRLGIWGRGLIRRHAYILRSFPVLGIYNYRNKELSLDIIFPCVLDFPELFLL